MLMFASIILAESDAQSSFFIEGQAVYPTFGAKVDGPDYYFINPFFSATNKKGNGFFIEGSFEPEVFSISPGLLISRTGKGKAKVYKEFGVGMGFEFPRLKGGQKELFLNDYFYLESHSEDSVDVRKRNKIILNFNHAYAESWKHWYMLSALYFPLKWLGIGAHAQSYAATGARVQLALPSGINIWAAGWPKEKMQFAVNVYF